MAFVVRPTTAIVTHGESREAEEERRQANVIREEDDSLEEDSWQHDQGGGGEADVWVAGGDDDGSDDGPSGRQPDSPMTPATASFAADYTQHPGRAPQTQRASQASGASSGPRDVYQTAAGSVGQLTRSSLDQLAEDSYARYTSVGLHADADDDGAEEAEGPGVKRDAHVPKSGAVDCRTFIR